MPDSISSAGGNRLVFQQSDMGFGKSETPQERSYSTREHAENMERLLVEHLNLANITLVLQDWGGSIGSAFALRNPDRVDRVCVCNTIVMSSRPEGIPGHWAIRGSTGR